MGVIARRSTRLRRGKELRRREGRSRGRLEVGRPGHSTGEIRYTPLHYFNNLEQCDFIYTYTIYRGMNVFDAVCVPINV